MRLNRIDGMENCVVELVDSLFYSASTVLNSAAWYTIRKCLSGESKGLGYEPDKYFKPLSDYVESKATEYAPPA